MTGMVITQPS